MKTRFFRKTVQKRIFGWDRDGTGMGQGWVMTHFFKGNCVLRPIFWHLDMIKDLCGVMEHLSEGNCVLMTILLGFGYDLGPMWGHGALLRRKLFFEDYFWIWIWSWTYVGSWSTSPKGTVFWGLFLGTEYDLGPMWGHGTLLRGKLCFQALFGPNFGILIKV